MSFWEDLQAWTQAQYDALMLANLKRKRKWTADDINRLLRDRISKRLKAKKGRVIGSEFLRTGGRTPAPEPPITYIGSDNGVLVWADPPTYPLQVHIGNYIAVYHTAGPTVIPGSDPPRSEYLTGLIGLHPTETCSGGASLPTYSGRESEVNPHDATIWDDETQGTLGDGNLRAERWSGLMRLWMQSRARIGLKVLPTVPTGFVLAPERMGLIRSPAGVYWLAYAHSTGIKVARMRIAYPGTYQCTLTIANAGTLSGAAQQLADVEALSRLELWLDDGATGDPDVVDLFVSTDAALLDVYKATTLTTTPYSLNRPTELLTSSGWGWVWRQQQRGSTDEDISGAAIVTFRPVWATADDYNTITRVSFLELEWDLDDRPSGNLSSDADQAFKPTALYTKPQSDIANTGTSQSVDRLRNNNGNIGFWYSANSEYSVDPTAGPYVLGVYYDSDGTLLTYEWVYATAQDYSSSSAEYSQCGWWDYPACYGTAIRWEQYAWRPAHFKFGTFESGTETAKIYREATPAGGAYPTPECFTCDWIETEFGWYGCWAVETTTPGLIWFVEDVNWDVGVEGGKIPGGTGFWGPEVVEDQLTRPLSYAVAGGQALAMDQTMADAVLSAVWADPDEELLMMSLVSYYDRALVYGANVPAGFAQSLADDTTAGIYRKALCGWA